MNRNRRTTADAIVADLRTNGAATEAAIARRLAMDPSNVRAICTQLHRLGEVAIQRDGTVTISTTHGAHR